MHEKRLFTKKFKSPSLLQHPAYTGNGDKGRFCCATALGTRLKQEDALYWCKLEPNSFNGMTSDQIGDCLKQTFLNLDQVLKSRLELFSVDGVGSTACTVIYDGQGHLITASLGDSVAFVVIQDSEGRPMFVKRLNETLHHPADPEEKERIIAAGYEVRTYAESQALQLSPEENVPRSLKDWLLYKTENEAIDFFSESRVWKGTVHLAMSRAMGDLRYKAPQAHQCLTTSNHSLENPSSALRAASEGNHEESYLEIMQKSAVSAEATISHFNLSEWVRACERQDEIEMIQVIVASDGFTEKPDIKLSSDLMDILAAYPETENKTLVEVFAICDTIKQKVIGVDEQAFIRNQHEMFLAELLGHRKNYKTDALCLMAQAVSTDNISVSSQSFSLDSKEPFMIGVYDGHGGDFVSEFIINNIGTYFSQTLTQMQQQIAEAHYESSRFFKSPSVKQDLALQCAALSRSPGTN